MSSRYRRTRLVSSRDAQYDGDTASTASASSNDSQGSGGSTRVRSGSSFTPGKFDRSFSQEAVIAEDMQRQGSVKDIAASLNLNAIRGPNVLKPTFRERDFDESFDENEFVERLTRSQVYRARAENDSAFDPLYFQTLFNNAISELHNLNQSVQEKLETLEAETRQREELHQANLTQLGTYMEGISENFVSLDHRINSVANSAVRIGDRLEQADSQLTKANDGSELIRYFTQFNQEYDVEDEEVYLDPVFHANANVQKAAVLMQRLRELANSVSTLDNTRFAKQHIQDYCERLEMRLLNEFRTATAVGNTDQMAECARTLYAYNGGEKAVSMFLGSRKMFAEPHNELDSHLYDEDNAQQDGEGDGTASTAWRSPLAVAMNTNTVSTVLSQLHRLFSQIIAMCESERVTIHKVFPRAEHVMGQLVEWLIEGPVTTYIHEILQRQRAKGKLNYLRALSASYTATMDWVTKMNEFELAETNPATKVESLFGEARALYMADEMECLSDLYNRAVSQFLAYQGLNEREEKKSMLAATFSRRPTTEQGPSLRSVDLFSEELVFDMLKLHQEAIRRCCSLSYDTEVAPNVLTLFQTLLKALGDKYLVVVLEASLTLIQDDQSSNRSGGSKGSNAPPAPDFFQVVSRMDGIVHSFNQHFQEHVVSGLASTSSLNDEAIAAKVRLIDILENLMNAGLVRMLGSMLAYTERILASEQKKNDFKPRDDELDFGTTVACNLSAAFIKAQYHAVEEHLDGSNLQGFLQAWGHQLYAQLLAHLKKYQVNTNGGLRLLRDATEYQESVALFGVAEVDERFEVLRDIANLFLVQPENLKVFLEDSTLNRMEREDIMALIANRSDYKSAGLRNLFG